MDHVQSTLNFLEEKCSMKTKLCYHKRWVKTKQKQRLEHVFRGQKKKTKNTHTLDFNF